MKGERRKHILISLKRKLLIKHNHLNYTEEKYDSPPPLPLVLLQYFLRKYLSLILKSMTSKANIFARNCLIRLMFNEHASI